MNARALGLWLALLITMALGAAWELQKLPDASARLAGLSTENPAVHTENIPLVPAEQEVFLNCGYLKKLVTVGPNQAILMVLDGTRNRHAIHDPTFCFRGAGWEIAGEEPFPLDHGNGSLVRLAKGNEKAEAVYWFTDGRKQFASPFSYWGATSARRLTFGASGSEPVLVILTPTTDAAPDWKAILKAWPELQRL